MKAWKASLCLAVVGLIVDHASAQQRLRDRPRELRSTGNVHLVNIRSEGRERSYYLLDASNNRPAPLIIVLHGGGGNGGRMIDRWAGKAQAESLIIAAPNGLGRNSRMGTWNASGCCGFAMESGVDDVAFVRAVIKEVFRSANVDRSQIYVTGFSNGGMLTHRVAIALGDQIAGAAVVSGALFGNESGPRSPTPMLIIHGDQDENVLPDGGMGPRGDPSLPYKSVRYAVDFWRQADGCTGEPVITERTGARIETSRTCRGGSEVVYYKLPSGGHAWPARATDVIWAFFAAHRRS